MPTMSGLCLAFFTTPNDKQILESDFMGLTFYVKVPEDDDPGVGQAMYSKRKAVYWVLKFCA